MSPLLELTMSIGIAAIIGGLVVVGRKLQVLDDIKDDIKDTKNFCNDASVAVVEIQTHLASKGYSIKNRLAYTANSPLKLTEYGKDLMENSGFDKIVANPEKRRFLINLVKRKNPKTNYDIQQYSMDTMAELVEINDSIVIPLKEYAYKEGLTLEIILNSAGIVLRDEIMKELKFDDKY